MSPEFWHLNVAFSLGAICGALVVRYQYEQAMKKVNVEIAKLQDNLTDVLKTLKGEKA